MPEYRPPYTITDKMLELSGVFGNELLGKAMIRKEIYQKGQEWVETEDRQQEGIAKEDRQGRTEYRQ